MIWKLCYLLRKEKIGEFYTVEKVKGKLADKLQLEELGVVPGAQIKLYTVVGSYVICMVNGDRISVNRELASNIFVIEEEMAKNEGVPNE